jgi:hypothetical protein
MANPIRTCLACGATDDHPRHVYALRDGAEVTYHIDCCAIARKCEHCIASLEGAPAGITGDAMRAHLTREKG